MGSIVCLMGKSSTGKDTIYKSLLEDNEYLLKRIVPYTTRPIRAGETPGVEYHFTDEAGYLALQTAGKIIEARAYHTYHGIWRYFTVDDGQITEDHNYLVIGTLEAYDQMKRYFGEEKMVPLLIELEDGVRLQRALDRENSQEHPKYEEMCRRFLADSQDFSEEKIKEVGIERRFVNCNLEQCLDEIKGYLKERL